MQSVQQATYVSKITKNNLTMIDKVKNLSDSTFVKAKAFKVNEIDIEIFCDIKEIMKGVAI